MSRSLRIALIGALLLPSSAAFAAAPEVSQVSIEEFQVDGAPRLLHLVGKNFTNSTTVTIGGLNANIVDWSADILSVAIPVPYYGDFEVAVTNTTVAKKGPNGTVVETYRFMWTYAALEGVPGPQGPIGPEGPMGPAGPQGATGATGPQGDQGLMGPQGLKGDKGDQGDVGPQGDQGLMGPQGLKGDKGDQGDVGPQGDKGDTGEQGLQGPPGQGSGIHAVVASDGSLVVARSNGIADSVKLGKGSYVLTFSRDVSACAWLASAAGNASVSTAEVSGVGEQVGITTLGVNGKAEDSGFTMIVSCPPAN